MQVLQESEGATQKNVNNIEGNGFSNIINVGSDPRKGKGIERLLKYVQREAIHDSSARGDLVCHPGTCEEYICEINGWGKGQWESEKRALLMTDPAGAGKSAIVRNLRPRWNDPTKFIPTIVYQLTTQYSAYRDSIDAVLLDDPLVLEKEMSIQWPQRRPSDHRTCHHFHSRADNTVFVGIFYPTRASHHLRLLIRLRYKYLLDTTPHTLPGNAGSDIEAYLRASFNMIRAKHNIPLKVAWPDERDIHRLVSQSAGLFVYAVTAIRHIDGLNNGRAGFEERLRAVLHVDAPSAKNPFSALDHLYTLLMTLIP